MAAESRPVFRPRVSARLRLTLGYAAFLIAAGAATLLGVYVVVRYVPNYPLTAANPRDTGPIAGRAQILGTLVKLSGYTLGGLAVIGLGGGWLLSGWVLRPLRRINEAAEIAATGRLDHRIRLSGRNDEFRQLADTFDHMLDRIADGFGAHERFAANAAHELRTPLAITETLLDVARRDPDGQDQRALIERLRITNARAIRLTEALLRLADANAITAVAEPVDLAAVVDAAVAEHAPEADGYRVTVTTRLERAPVVGDAALLAQLAANLVQNAIRHNHSPGSAWVSTHHDPRRRSVTLRVQNTGDVYPADVAARLAEPFLRGTGRAGRPSRDTASRDAAGGGRGAPAVPGHGLGLTLVARITEVHGGRLAIVPRNGGGLDVSVTLPDRDATPGSRSGGSGRNSGTGLVAGDTSVPDASAATAANAFGVRLR
ncbi:sensor histidine kinase [Rugosimonospora africana]|uniref:histidine kinase n=1 Tax=Rugosimonospora africana TaxID=556532 RepID=A0A8J3VTV8_9ACTN|nr:HAMP domain-containing sensor histidine kinase [Rugosimonospora africana]GIH18822.1 two-component sensor histidine kinase [Rugosimonospora africana]